MDDHSTEPRGEYVMRTTIIIGAIVLLAGCVAIPPAISIASWAVNGASLMISGKSVSDHAISAVLDQDCAMWRILKGDPICVDYPAEDGSVMVAELEPPVDLNEINGADDAISATAATADEFEAGQAVQVAAIAAGDVDADHAYYSRYLGVPALPSDLADGDDVDAETAAGPAIEGPTLLASIAPAAGTADDDRLDFEPPVPAVVVPVVGASVTAWSLEPAAAVSVAQKPSSQPAPGKSIVTASSTADPLRSRLVLASAEVRAEPEIRPAIRYVVIGSFRRVELARVHAAKYGDLRPSIVEARVEGRLQRRVVTGPFRKTELKPALRRAQAQGIEGAWVLRAENIRRPVSVAVLAPTD
jgi:hypothetical protein